METDNATVAAIAAALRRGDHVEFPTVVAAPHRHRPFPAWRYHATKDPVLVETEAEARDLGTEWGASPAEARAIKERFDEAIADAAAVRAWDDRRLGEKARVELTAHERDAGDHVLDVPAKKEQNDGQPG